MWIGGADLGAAGPWAREGEGGVEDILLWFCFLGLRPIASWVGCGWFEEKYVWWMDGFGDADRGLMLMP